MDLNLSCQNMKQLILFSKSFINRCLPFLKIVKILVFIYILFYLAFHSYTSLFKVSDFLFFCSFLIILYMIYVLYALILYKKYNNKHIHINFEDGTITLPGKSPKAINRKKSKMLNEHEIMLVLNVYVSFANIGIPIFSQSCDKESFEQLKNYIRG